MFLFFLFSVYITDFSGFPTTEATTTTGSTVLRANVLND